MRAQHVEIYPLATKKFEPVGSKRLLTAGCSWAPEQEGVARINHSTVLRESQSQHLWGSGYVVLLLLTGLPPFMIADALVLLLGVTPAFGTVSPTSCKDGSRYMATSDGEGRRKRRRYPVSFTHRPQLLAQSRFPWSQVTPSRGNSCFKAVKSSPQTENITSLAFSGLCIQNTNLGAPAFLSRREGLNGGCGHTHTHTHTHTPHRNYVRTASI